MLPLPCRILVLEGDPPLLDALRLAAETAGSAVQVSIANTHSREEVLGVLRSNVPDILFLGRSGFKEALSLLKESAVDPGALPPVVLLDPSPSPNNERLAFESGALFYHPLTADSLNTFGFRRMARTLLEMSRLRLGETRYRNLMEQAVDPIILAGRDLRILDVNEAGCTQQGNSRAELQGSSITDHLDPADLQEHPLQMEALARGETVIEERRIRRKDGSYFPAEVCSRALPDGSLTAIIRDITHRKSEDELLREKEKFYLTLLDNSRDAAIVVGKSGLVTYEAPSTRLVLGRKPGENVGKSAFVNMHPEDRDRVMGAFRDVSRRPGAVLTLELRMKHSDGSWRWIEGIARNLLDDPLIQGVVINYRDVTERHEAEEALRRSERHFRALIESSFDVIGVLDEKGVVVYQSPSTKHVMGFDASEVVGRSSFERLHPDDQARVARVMTDLVRSPGKTVVTFMRTRHADGSWRDTEVVARNLIQDPDVRGIVYNFRDVTERKRIEEALQNSENYFRALIEKATDIIVVFDAEGRILYESPSIQRALGYSPDERTGKNVFELLHPEDLPKARSLFQTLLANPETPVKSRLRLRNRDGTWRTIEGIGTNLLSNPAVQGLVLNYHDITKALEAQDELIRYERLAALGGITAGLAHEIRNPLATILTTAQYLRSKNPDAQTAADLERIMAQGERIKHLVTETLDFSRKPVLHPEEIPLPDVVRRSLEQARAQFGPDHQKTRVSHEVPAGLPAVLVDRGQMEQVFSNLLMNAFQALSPKGGAISVEYGIMDSEIQVSVRDDGPGIRNEDLEKVFEPFFTTKKHGAGLGLSICQRLVRDHGGKIAVKRGSTGGSVFTVHLPFVKGSGAS